MDLAQLEIRIARTTSIPLLSGAATEIMGLVDNLHTSIREYERIILRDPVLTANILRAANSAYYGGGGQISNLSGAIARLGINTVRSICISAAFHTSLRTKKIHALFDAQSFWQHSLAVACSSKVLGVMMHYPEPERAFIAGLLHDVGKIAMYLFMPLQMNLIHRAMEAEPITQFDAEEQLLQVTHQDCGKLVMQKWQLPCIYGEAIGNHHHPFMDRDKADSLALLVHIGNGLAHRAGIPSVLNEPDPGVDSEVLEELGLQEDQLNELAKIIAGEVAKLSCSI